MTKTGNFRWIVLTTIFVVTLINYAVRAALSLAAPSLSQDLGINKVELGIVFSAFGWSYAAAQIPGGWLLDKYGASRVYLWAIIAWSLLTAAHAGVLWAGGFSAITALFILRFLVGIAEAPSFPGNARIVAGWFPARERGTASAIYNAAQYCSPVVLGIPTGWIISQFGWQASFLAIGCLGLVMAFFWPKIIRDARSHPKLSAQELNLIRDGGGLVDPVEPSSENKMETRHQLRVLLTNKTLWGLYIGQFFINTLTYFFITWFPVYLIEERHLSVLKASIFATAPGLCGFAGGVLGGVVSDWMLRRGTSLTVARKTPVIIGMLIATSIIACRFTDSNTWILIFMSLAFFGKGFGGLGWAIMSDVAPRECAGLSGGIFNMFGNLTAIFTPIIIGFILQATHSFNLVLSLIAVAALIAACSYLFLVGTIKRIELS